MNYEILLLDALKKEDQKYRHEYIYREFKQAEKEYYSKDAFFSKCFSILNEWKSRIDESFSIMQTKFFEEENNIHLAKGTDEQKKRALQQLENERKTSGIETVAITISKESHKIGEFPFAGIIKLADVQILNEAVTKALQLVENGYDIEKPQQNTKQKNKLSDIITHKNSIDIVEGIKIQYKNIKGKRLKLLLLAFQDLELLPKERIAQKFYNCCSIEFNWNIASYNAMNGYDYNDVTDSDEFNSMKQYLETLIKTK